MQLGGTFFGTCSSEGSQTTKIVNDCLGFVLYTGASIYVRFTETNTGALSSLMLNVNNTGAKPIKRYGTTNLNTLDAITAGMVCNFVYDGSYWQWVGQMNTDTNTIPSAYCNTITSNPAKVAQCTDFVLRDNSYISIIFAQGNTSAGAFTLNINDTGAKQVYLNGHISGQSNYQFSAGSYILYYDGTAYQMRTDGLIHGATTGNIINITNDGSTIYYMYGDGTTASFVIPHTQYTAGSAISISNNQITNTGVRAIGQGTENGTISVNTSGVTTNVAVKGLGSAAYENANTFASAGHIHGNISNLGYITGNNIAISSGDSLLIADASDDDRLVKTAITFDGITTNQFLTKAGTWATAQATSVTEAEHSSSATYALNDADGNEISETYVKINDFNTKLAATDAMQFKGTLGTGGTITALPAAHSQGDSYKVITVGTYAGVKCEVGDLVICLADGTEANDAHWTVVQTNLDGAVTGPVSATDGQVALYNGTSGKVIKAATINKGSLVETVTFTPNETVTLGSNISADDITSWVPNEIPTTTVNNGVLIFYAGTTATLAWSDKSIPNVTSVGTTATFTYTTASYVKTIE